MPLTAEEEVELLDLLGYDPTIEQVAPKLEAFRNPSRIKVAYGGRGAGAKSWSIASLLVQRGQREKLNVLCTREIQLSLEESVYRLVINTIDRLHYPGWYVTKEFIQSPKKGRFYFRGLKDLRAAAAIKGLEDIDIAWVEEGAAVSHDSLNMLFPTIRKPGSEIWVSFNREEEMDPVYERLVKTPRDDSIVVFLEPGPIDNPWWTPLLQKEMEEDYKRDPDLAEHVWGGQPRSQGLRSVFSRTSIRGAMDREIKAVGAIEIGVDVARFGDDLTVMYKRHGLKVIEKRERIKQDVVKTADDAWDMAGHDSNIAIKVDDTGVGGGVTDNLNKLGAHVIPINFGGKPKDEDKFTSTADEMWFEFPMDEADIPNDQDLMIELSGRYYDYDNKSRKKIEPKKEYKKRNGKSPDHADALLLTFYNPEAFHILQEPDWSAGDLGL
jgi:phage terminase large subunit